MSHLTPLLALLLLAADDRPEPPPDGARVRLGTSRFRNGSAILSVAMSPDPVSPNLSYTALVPRRTPFRRRAVSDQECG